MYIVSGAVDSPFFTMFLDLEPTVHDLSLPRLAFPSPSLVVLKLRTWWCGGGSPDVERIFIPVYKNQIRDYQETTPLSRTTRTLQTWGFYYLPAFIVS
jgi:hypothetical protein